MRIFPWLPLAVLVAGCAAQQQLTTETATTAADGWRREPVVYNSRRYSVAFRAVNARERLVRVSAPGRRLGSSAGDGRIVARIATLTVGHFSCRDPRKVQVRPGSLRPQQGSWALVVVCG